MTKASKRKFENDFPTHTHDKKKGAKKRKLNESPLFATASSQCPCVCAGKVSDVNYQIEVMKPFGSNKSSTIQCMKDSSSTASDAVPEQSANLIQSTDIHISMKFDATKNVNAGTGSSRGLPEALNTS